MVFRLWLWLALCGAGLPGRVSAQPTYPLEGLIDRFLEGSGLSVANQLRLSAWLELRGDYDPGHDVFSVRFGDIASMQLYQGNWVLRTQGHRIFHLDRHRKRPTERQLMDEALHRLFEQIPLLAQAGADPALVRFVDESLARKPLEPFAKLYLRHLFIHHGEFNGQVVAFRSDRLPVAGDTPVRLHLDRQSLRGYYLRSGGTAYVEDVDRAVSYATGEASAPHIAAFKLLAQTLFQETTTYVTAQRRDMWAAPSLPLISRSGPESGSMAAPLPVRYPPDQWIGTLLLQLRRHNLSIGDPDILPYFIDQPYFPQIYTRLTPQERAEVDRFRGT
ncbi:MAG: hypothetical protein D6722_13615 [Bacteroidetes bacterium]|nr:MAG: hypothetical protein D6722_13615 [Bacteroidota bacterium]